MKRTVWLWTLMPLLVSLLGACGNGSGDHPDSLLSALRVHDTSVTIHAAGQPDAVVGAAGELRIGDQAIAVNGAQRAQLSLYFAQASAVQHDGIAVGKAGAKTALHAIGGVVSGLANGDPDSIGPKVDAEAAKVEAAAAHLCEDLEALRKTQDALASAIPAFRLYAVIDSRRIEDCR
ncbi:MAG TPA: hypothetical protein VFG55_07210 [Rhodanobacteraceae bacterium]|nr:hypothetical protein [Rhodanobacteraceae bacterium]